MMKSASSSRDAGSTHAIQHWRQQMLMRYRARLVVDGDGDPLARAWRRNRAERIVDGGMDDSGRIIGGRLVFRRDEFDREFARQYSPQTALSIREADPGHAADSPFH